MSQPLKVAVVGAGLTGLTVAHHLKKNGCEVSVFEASDTAGGMIRSAEEGNWLGESGYGMLSEADARITALINELELRDEVIDSGSALSRFYYAERGKLNRIPLSVGAAIRSGFLPFSVRMRLLFGRFRKIRPDDADTAERFLNRYLGEGATSRTAELLAQVFWGGNAQEMMAKHAFPQLFEAVSERQSLVRGLKVLEKRRGSGRMVAFRHGMRMLTGALSNELENQLYLGARVVQVKRHEDRWLVGMYIGDQVRYDLADRVIFTVPAYALGSMYVGDAVNPLLETVSKLEYAPLAVLNMGFKKADIRHKLDAFGFAVSPREERSFSGVMFTSSVLEERSPGGHHLINVFVGGAGQPDLASEPVHKIKTQVLKDLDHYIGVRAYPAFVKPFVFPKALPQYGADSGEIFAAKARFEAEHPGVYLTGQYCAGPGISNTLLNGIACAQRVISKDA